MKAKILKLQPNSRFHFGKSNVISRLRVEEDAEEGNGQHYFDVSASLTDTDSFLHSDVLFAALVNNLAQVKSKEAVDEFVKAFEQGTIKISSGFYCLESNFEDQQLPEYVYLFPRPVTAPNFVSIDNYDRIKQIKKVLFVCPDTLSTHPESWQLLGNIAVSVANRKRIDCEKTFVYEGDGVPEKKQRKTNFKLFSKGVATHVGLHRPNENAYGPYSVSYIQIPDYQELKLKVHFYFLYKVEDQYKPDFELAVELLKYNGIGGERSTGYGQISEIDDANIPFLDKKTDEEAWMSLSMLIPEKDELADLCFYQYSHRGGRMTENHLRLKSVPMIYEGAILQKPLKGKIASISPEKGTKKVFKRNGKGFCIPVSSIFSKEVR